VTIDQDEDGEKNYCYIGATRSWNGYGPWMCCNHALIAGWPEYDREACNHCLYRRAQVEKQIQNSVSEVSRFIKTHLVHVTGCDFPCPYLQIHFLDFHALVHSLIDSLNHTQPVIAHRRPTHW
jgi:hypothetical protein